MIEKILGRRIGLSRVYIALERGARAFWPVWTLLFVEDTQATGLNDPAAQALWARHQDMMAERAESVRVAPPDLRLSGRDPWALRLMAVVGVLAALIFARGDGFSGTAIVPDGGDPLAAGPSFEAWASPPAYTGKPVIYLTEDTDQLHRGDLWCFVDCAGR